MQAKLRRPIAGAIGIACVQVAILSSCGSDSSRPTRIVLVTLDTLRLDGFAGSETRPSAMPRTLSFARNGRIFANYFSATSTTQPSHASLLTGMHPWEHGVTRNGQRLGPEVSTVAEVLRLRGYATAAVVASYPLHRQFGFDQGFQSYDDDFDVDITGRQWSGRPLGEHHFYSLATHITDRAIERIDLAEGPLQFFWFHYFDSHDPYGDSGDEVVELSDVLALVGKRSPEMGELIERAREGYDLDNASLDGQLDRLFRRLADDADRFETHIVVTSDHGEGFGESLVFGHGPFVTPELIHVPLFIVSPRFEPGVDSIATGSVDVATTLIAFADPGSVFGQGRDLTDSGRATRAESIDEQSGLLDGTVVGMATPPKARHRKPRIAGRKVPNSRLQFYATHRGSMITGNAARLRPEPEDPELAREIRSLFADFEDAYFDNAAVELTDPETRRALEALGYAE